MDEYGVDWTGYYVAFICIVAFAILATMGLILILVDATEDPTNTVSYECKSERCTACENTCEKFNMDFYKYYSGSRYESRECWCIDNGTPKSIGQL